MLTNLHGNKFDSRISKKTDFYSALIHNSSSLAQCFPSMGCLNIFWVACFSHINIRLRVNKLHACTLIAEVNITQLGSILHIAWHWFCAPVLCPVPYVTLVNATDKVGARRFCDVTATL